MAYFCFIKLGIKQIIKINAIYLCIKAKLKNAKKLKNCIT